MQSKNFSDGVFRSKDFDVRWPYFASCATTTDSKDVFSEVKLVEHRL